MIIKDASFEILERDEARGGLSIIETAGRTCYKSEHHIADGSAKRFIESCIRRRHESILEHGDYIFLLDDEKIYDNVAEEMRTISETRGYAPHICMTNIAHRPIVSGNIRAWRELINASTAGLYFTGRIDPIYTADIRSNTPEAWWQDAPDPRVHQITYGDLKGLTEHMAHQRQTVRFIVDRGISHEIVRHRKFSFAQESTRYCNYANERFGGEITVIRPCYLDEGTEGYALWKRQCMSAEAAYFTMLKLGHTPQEARAVLPTSTKTEIIATGTLGDWERFFDLRARQKTGPVHPQMLEVAAPLLKMDAALIPNIFEY